VIDASAQKSPSAATNSEPPDEEERALFSLLEGRPALIALNKSDLVPDPSDDVSDAQGIPAIRTSALTGQGIPELREAILQLAIGGAAAEPGMLTSLRHHQAITQAMQGLDDARAAVDSSIPHEMVLLDLYRSLWALDSLTGQTTNEDILKLIFSTFCIGK
jgi:tRNA modification GTPase